MPTTGQRVLNTFFTLRRFHDRFADDVGLNQLQAIHHLNLLTVVAFTPRLLQKNQQVCKGSSGNVVAMHSLDNLQQASIHDHCQLNAYCDRIMAGKCQLARSIAPYYYPLPAANSNSFQCIEYRLISTSTRPSMVSAKEPKLVLMIRYDLVVRG